MSKIAFIGLGMMGAPMAHLLHQVGHYLTVKDVNPAVVEQFLSQHANAAAAASDEQIANNDFIITMLPSSSIVNVVVGPLLAHLSPGTTIIEMSSADPMQTRELAAKVSATGAALNRRPRVRRRQEGGRWHPGHNGWRRRGQGKKLPTRAGNYGQEHHTCKTRGLRPCAQGAE